jgi:hypothetical protein
MRRSLGLRLLPLLLPLAGALVFACGDLVVPGNSGDSSGDGEAAGGDGEAAGGDGASQQAVELAPDAHPPPNCNAAVYPVALACTGLYQNWAQLEIAPDVRVYHPGATLWADGASSIEWVWLPPGVKIDTTDLNGWVFPVGTKFWQELSLLGARVETRFLWKMGPGQWFRVTFAWTADQSAAPALTAGSTSFGGLPYDIPSVGQCDQCHGGAADFVLGFEIVGLAMPSSSGLNLQALEQMGILSNPPSASPVIPGSDPPTTGSLAFLHANCGTSCHNRNPDANAGQTGLFLKLLVDPTGALPGTPASTDTWRTSIDVPSSYTPAGFDAGGFWRLRPGDVAHSMIPWRASRRNTSAQMPPIATELVDQNDVTLLDSWVGHLGGPSDAGADR